MIDDLYDRGKWYLYHLAIGTLDFHTGRGQRLRSLHAAHDAAHPVPVPRNDLNIAFAVERLKRRQSFGDFHLVNLRKLRLVVRLYFVG